MLRRSLLVSLVFSLGLFLGPIARSHADVIIGNLPNANNFGSRPISTSAHAAHAFTMGGAAYTLDSLDVDLAGGSNPQPIPVFEIRDDNGGLPGSSILATLTIPGYTGNGPYTFTPTAPMTLLANTKYWLYGSADSFGINWVGPSLLSGLVTPSGAGATFSGYLISNNGGSSWLDFSSSQLPGYQLNGTIVPEPSTLGLLGIGGLILFAWRRRASRQPGHNCSRPGE